MDQPTLFALCFAGMIATPALVAAALLIDSLRCDRVAVRRRAAGQPYFDRKTGTPRFADGENP